MDDKYCYPDSNVLINKLNIRDLQFLFDIEAELAATRLLELQKEPLKGKFDFNHLKAIHKYIFQDIYDWAGEKRTVDIAKDNLFCPVLYLDSYALEIFNNYYEECYTARENKNTFVKALAKNFGDLNALHPFREGNGRAQREFARLVCLKCGYIFDIFYTNHDEMVSASVLSFNKGDNSEFEKIFTKAISPYTCPQS